MLALALFLLCAVAKASARFEPSSLQVIFERLREADTGIKLLVDSMKAKSLQERVEAENPHVGFFTRKQQKFFSYVPDEPVDFF